MRRPTEALGDPIHMTLAIDTPAELPTCPIDQSILELQDRVGPAGQWVCPRCAFRQIVATPRSNKSPADVHPLSRESLLIPPCTETADAGKGFSTQRSSFSTLRSSSSTLHKNRWPASTGLMRGQLFRGPSGALPTLVDSLVQPLLRIDAAPPPAKPIELFYDSIAEKFDDLMNLYDMRRRVETVFDVFLKDRDLRGRKVLDAGCGTGWFSQRACRHGADVTALDIGPRLLEQVRRKCNARTVCGSVLDLRFESNSFDVVISSECIEHTCRPQDAVRELVRVCRPGGLIAITSNNHFWFWLCALANRLKLRPYEGIENWPRWSDFHSWIRQENVRILDRRGIHAFPFQVSLFHPLLKFLDRFGRLLGPVCVNQAILAIKQC